MGFNMSWIFVDEIDQNALFVALDLAPTDELSAEAKYDVGTSRVPLAALQHGMLLLVQPLIQRGSNGGAGATAGPSH